MKYTVRIFSMFILLFGGCNLPEIVKESSSKNQQEGLKDLMLKWENQPLVDSCNVLKIGIYNKNKIVIEGEKHPIQSLKATVKNFISSDTTEYTGWLFLKTNDNTLYEFYRNVHDTIILAYEEVWDKKSLEIYNENYDSLDKDRRDTINHLVPKVIRENW